MHGRIDQAIASKGLSVHTSTGIHFDNQPPTDANMPQADLSITICAHGSREWSHVDAADGAGVFP